MASFGTTTTYIGDGKFGITFDWIISSQSITDNTTTINWMVQLYSYTSTGIYQTYSTYLNVKIDGVNTGYTGVDYTLLGNSSKILASGTAVIAHNADGNKTFSYSFDGTINTSLGKFSGSGSGVLDPIPKPATLSTAPNFTDEENPTITYSNPSGEALTTLEACIANSKGNQIYVPYRAVSKTGTSYTFDLTIDERNALRSAAGGSSLAVRFYLKSVIEDITYYKYLDRTMTLEDIAPTLNPVVKDVDTTIVALTGNDQSIVLGFSDVYYEIGATPPSGASLLLGQVKCGALTQITETGTFTDVDTNIFEFAALDSRGNVAMQTIEMDVIPYIKVTCNQTVRLNLDGTIALTVKGNYFTDSFGAASNTLSVQNRYREDGGDWSEWGALDPLISDMSDNSYTLTATISGFDPSGTYEFQSRAVDKLTSAESAVESVTLKPIFDWGKYDFNFNVPLTIEGDPLADYVIEQGTEAMGTNGTWYWSKWKSGKAECYGCRNYGNMAVSTAWGGLYRSEAFTQDLPFGLFTETPEYINATFRNADNYGGFIAGHEESAPTSGATGSFIVVRPASANLTQVYISFNVIGRWK